MNASHLSSLRCIFLLGVFVMGSLPCLRAEGFDEVHARIHADVLSAGEADILAMLKLSREELKVDQALLTLEDWLKANTPKSPAVFGEAGLAAELIGEYKKAQEKYSAYLRQAKPSDSGFNDLSYRHARILFERLKLGRLEKGLYIIGLKAPTTWKYNRDYWSSLDRRGDLKEKLTFLISLIEAGVPPEVLKEDYGGWFHHTAEMLRKFCVSSARDNYAPYKDLCEKLASLVKFDPELYALWKWKSAICSFFHNLTNEKTPPLEEAKSLLTISPDYIDEISRDALGWHRWHKSTGHFKKVYDPILAFVQKEYTKASAGIQFAGNNDGKPENLSFRSDVAKEDKAFQEKVKAGKLTVEEATAIITSRDPQKLSYLRYVFHQEYQVDKHRYPKFRMDREEHKDYRGYPSGRHVLFPAVLKALESGAESDWINPDLFRALFNTRCIRTPFPRVEEQDVLRKVAKSKAFKKLPMTHRVWIEGLCAEIRRGEAAKSVAEKLKGLNADSSFENISEALSFASGLIKNSHHRFENPPGADGVAEAIQDRIKEPEVYRSVAEYLSHFSGIHGPLSENTYNAMVAAKDYNSLHIAAFQQLRHNFHHHYERYRYPPFKELLEILVTEQSATAAFLARNTLLILAQSPSNYFREIRKDQAFLHNILNKSMENMGIVTIPVPKTDPSYPLFISQQQLSMGNEGTAWELLKENALVLADTHRQLNPSYLLWALEEMNKVNSQEEELIGVRDELFNLCSQWVADKGPFALPQQVMLDLLKGDAALSGDKSLEAKAMYKGVLKNGAYADEPTRFEAHLRLAEVDRKARDFEGALFNIEELLRSAPSQFKVRGLLGKANVFFDKGDYEGTKEILTEVKNRDPMNNQATILQGKVMIKEKNFRPGFQLAIGDLNAQEWITTGEKLQINLNDPGLTSSAGGTIIEVDVWSSSGDREKVVLGQAGDSKHQFTGAVSVQLGAPSKGDSILQVTGDDTIQYSYNEDFAKRMRLPDLAISGKIRVKSDATLKISSSPILNPLEEAGRSDAEESYKRSLRPGQPLYLRVVDDDRSRTEGIDEVFVNVSTSSGDRVNRVALKETGTHSGVFMGSISTTPSLPGVISRQSSSGKNSNALISPKDYGTWTSVPFMDRDPVRLLIDLNDNVELGELRIVNKDKSINPTHLTIKTGMNPRKLTPVAHFPDNKLVLEPLFPSVRIYKQPYLATRHPHDQLHPEDIETIMGYLKSGSVIGRRRQDARNIRRHYSDRPGFHQLARQVGGPSELLTAVDITAFGLHHQNEAIISSFEGHFHEKNSIERTFRLVIEDRDKKEGGGNSHTFHLLVNGKVIAGGQNKIEGTVKLEPGLHSLRIIGAGTKKELMPATQTMGLFFNGGQEGSMIPCPDDVFSPNSFPAHFTELLNKPASIEAKNGEVIVNFHRGSRARVIELNYLDKKGAKVSIDKIHLTSKDGKKVLPLEMDFQELAKNRSLEVLIGDRVQVTYQDDRFVGQKEATSTKKYEDSLSVNYKDARISVALKGKGPGAIKYNRFAYGTPVPILVEDSDMDLTPNLSDTVKVKVMVSGQKNPYDITIKEHEGAFGKNFFMGFVTPLKSVAEERARRQKEGITKPLINPIEVPKGGSLSFIYHDRDNANPGVPTDRFVDISHAAFEYPILKLPNFRTQHIEEDPGEETQKMAFLQDLTPPYPEGDMRVVEGSRRESDFVGRRKGYGYTLHQVSEPPEGGFNFFMGLKVPVVVRAPHLVLKSGSSIKVYLQAESTRRRFEAGEFGEVEEEESGGSDDAFVGFEGSDDFAEGFDDFDSDDDGFGADFASEEEEVAFDLMEEKEAPPQSESSKAIFNLSIPGTVEVTCYNSTEGVPPGKITGMSQYEFPPYIPLEDGTEYVRQDGTFTGEVLVRSGQVDLSWLELAKITEVHVPLFVAPKDTVHIGYHFIDEEGKEQWITAEAKVNSGGVLDVMDQSYKEPISQVFLGERAYIRVADMGRDTSPDLDTTSIHISSKSGAKAFMGLTETQPNSATFKGSLFLVHAESAAAAKAMIEDPQYQKNGRYDAMNHGFPVTYGDTVRIRYKDSAGEMAPFHQLTIGQGSDGYILPFTKTYSDSGLAMNAQFAMAEAHLELAKRRRKLAGEARKEGLVERAEALVRSAGLSFKSARDLLDIALNTLTKPEDVAKAHQMLGTLIYEDALRIPKENLEKREDLFRTALERFNKVSKTYRNTSSGAQAQFMKALTYERLREPEMAASEYVKLAYRYPDSDLLGTAMARLGFHFLKKAEAINKPYEAYLKEKNLKNLALQLEMPKGTDPQVWSELQRKKREMGEEFLRSASILDRMIRRFPNHEYAARSGLVAGYGYRKAGQFEKSAQVYEMVYNNQSFLPEDRAQAMYWAAKMEFERGDMMTAYTTYMQLTVDFPETKWAANARSELESEEMVEVQEKLEMEEEMAKL